METLLAKDPDINVVYTINEPSAAGAYEALKAVGKEGTTLWVQVFDPVPMRMLRLARRDVDALARCFGDGPYFGGAQPCGADATVYAFTLGALCPAINSPLREAVQAHPILTRYTDRMTGDYFS